MLFAIASQKSVHGQLCNCMVFDAAAHPTRKRYVFACLTLPTVWYPNCGTYCIYLIGLPDIDDEFSLLYLTLSIFAQLQKITSPPSELLRGPGLDPRGGGNHSRILNCRLPELIVLPTRFEVQKGVGKMRPQDSEATPPIAYAASKLADMECSTENAVATRI